ncbi:DUF1543 domain-containing protein [Stenotrophomonas sp. YIM B06876]|uniref:DUF1543 domain-containing protein n=1 Tax=Stenotrophomonas sp. YIM B06876 TaxID=3060211 RepID=UPI002739C32B|nr:DUF1543 domain-containing protein [Stenotrophomonas sp. YIM B06876]
MRGATALRLFVVMLGGRHARARTEVHDVAFAVAANLDATHAQLRQQWFGEQKGVHIDSWLEVEGVDGWQLHFAGSATAPGQPRLFFVNLGGYVPGHFGEAHRYLLVVAGDAAEAGHAAKSRIDPGWLAPHKDALLDVDDCLPIDVVGGRFVHLVPGPHRPAHPQSDYILLH